jgi:hypothetical protein
MLEGGSLGERWGCSQFHYELESELHLESIYSLAVWVRLFGLLVP